MLRVKREREKERGRMELRGGDPHLRSWVHVSL
jgi:hypothetical protein